MANASELFKAGKLQEALAAQTQEVKNKPGDQAKRLFLFELLAFAGDLDRARRQIGAGLVLYEDADLETAATAYRKLLDAEEGAAPSVPRRRVAGVPGLSRPRMSQRRLEAVNRLRQRASPCRRPVAELA